MRYNTHRKIKKGFVFIATKHYNLMQVGAREMDLKVYYNNHKQFIVSYDIVGAIKWISVIEYKGDKTSFKTYSSVEEMDVLDRQSFATARIAHTAQRTFESRRLQNIKDKKCK